MKIKGWEVVRWETSRGYPTWKNNKEQYLLVRFDKNTKVWYVESPQRGLQSKIKGKKVWMTKKDAMKFAINWMKKHPYG